MPVSRQQFFLQFVDVIDFRHGNDGKLSQMGIDDDRLRIRIADDSDTCIARELRKSGLELGSEIRIFQIMD